MVAFARKAMLQRLRIVVICLLTVIAIISSVTIPASTGWCNSEIIISTHRTRWGHRTGIVIIVAFDYDIFVKVPAITLAWALDLDSLLWSSPRRRWWGGRACYLAGPGDLVSMIDVSVMSDDFLVNGRCTNDRWLGKRNRRWRARVWVLADDDLFSFSFTTIPAFSSVSTDNDLVIMGGVAARTANPRPLTFVGFGPWC
jgi:hypothetical protein